MNKYKGEILIALSAIFFSTYGIWSKLMTGSFGEFSQAWSRAIIILIVLIPFGILTKGFKRIQRNDIRWFVVISLCGGLNQAPYFLGFEHLNVGTATLIFYTMLTIGAYIIGKLFFSEALTKPKLVSLLLAVVGLSIIYPIIVTSSTELLAALATTAAGLMGAGVVVLSKKLSGNYSETQILTSVFLSMLIGNLVIAQFTGDQLPLFTNISAWSGQFLYAAAMIVANGLVVAGFKYVEPSIGGIIGLLEVITAVIFGILLFSEIVTPGILIGIIIVLSSIVLPLIPRRTVSHSTT